MLPTFNTVSRVEFNIMLMKPNERKKKKKRARYATVYRYVNSNTIDTCKYFIAPLFCVFVVAVVVTTCELKSRLIIREFGIPDRGKREGESKPGKKIFF